MSCHETGPAPVRGAVATAPSSGRMLLVGAPNVGKSTLFNALTGARQRTVNAPGTTVELATGTWHIVDTGQSASTEQSTSTGTARATTRSRTLVDLPGTYSLLARSADEQVTADAVLELARTPGSGVAVVVLDASALTRSLYLLAQVARTGAPVVADRAMRSLGLDGRALLPLVVGFGCNLPALAATRTLPNARRRLLTGLLVPLTSCSARLTVYVLLAGAFFPGYAGTAIFLMYVTSVALVLGGGLLLRRTAFRDVRPEPLVLVLPAYQRPRLRPLTLTVRSRVGAFVAGAGKIIVATMLVVWVLMAIPVAGQHAVGDVPVADSAYGRVASAITPILSPAGFGNDHASAALITGFVAKEVVVGSFAQSYAVAEPGDAARAGSLGDRLRESFATSSGGHGAAAAAAFLVFVLAYTPCVATLAEQRRLFGWRPTLGAVSAQLVTAWLLAVLVFQIGSRL